jgi:P4 family phage/plasmid primase-like protien
MNVFTNGGNGTGTVNPGKLGFTGSLEVAKKFLSLLGGKNEAFCYQTFDDSPAKSGHLVRVLHGTIDELSPELHRLNQEGAGIFVTINEIKPGTSRKKENVTRVRALVLDLDCVPLKPVLKSSLQPHIVVQTSPGKYHCWYFVDGCSLERFTELQVALARRFGGDLSVKDMPRVMRLPGFYHQKNPDKPFLVKAIHENQNPAYLTQELIERIGLDLTKDPENSAKQVSSNGMDGENIFEGGRNNFLASEAGKYKFQGVTNPDVMFPILCQINQTRCKPPLPNSEVKVITNSICRYPQRRPLTDAGNAERLFDQYCGELKYCHQWGKFFIWNGVEWEVDDSSQVYKLAINSVRGVFDEVKHTTDKKMQKRLAQHAIASQSKSRLTAMIDLVKHLVPVNPEEFDANPWHINCRNGTIDLKQKKLLPHNPANLITKTFNAKFDNSAECPRWETFVHEIMAEDQGMVDFLQRTLGYGMSGSTDEQCAFFLHGRGKNGKSTLLEVAMELYGGFAKKAQMATFLSKRSDSVRNDLASLCGARFVAASEAGRGKKLDEPLLKEITGSDSITCRFLFKEQFTFKPQFKIFLALNNLPQIDGVDEGIWRRVRLIPFNYIVPEKDVDPNLSAKLRGEFDGIFMWILRGAINWLEHGLNPPTPVIEATGSYRQDEDLLENFFDERCVLDQQGARNGLEKEIGTVPVAEIYSDFVRWLGDQRAERVTKRLFGRLMSERGFRSEQKKIDGVNTKVYRGLRLSGHGDFDFQ